MRRSADSRKIQGSIIAQYQLRYAAVQTAFDAPDFRMIAVFVPYKIAYCSAGIVAVNDPYAAAGGICTAKRSIDGDAALV